MPLYVLDSSFFIQAHRSNSIDVATGFWNKIRQLANEGKIISIDKVKNEIYEKNDALEQWCRANLPEDFFKETSGIMTEYAKVIEWAVSKSDHYLQKALNEFLDVDDADAFIIAFCLADRQNRILVSQEISEPNRRNKVKIPDVYMAFNISCINTIEMFRQLGETSE